MSENLANQFRAYLDKQLYRRYDFLITMRGTGYQTKYTVEAIPIAK
jgi:hypothetical protein